jgi:hypothetical protein
MNFEQHALHSDRSIPWVEIPLGSQVGVFMTADMAHMGEGFQLWLDCSFGVSSYTSRVHLGFCNGEVLQLFVAPAPGDGMMEAHHQLTGLAAMLTGMPAPSMILQGTGSSWQSRHMDAAYHEERVALVEIRMIFRLHPDSFSSDADSPPFRLDARCLRYSQASTP